MCVFSRGVGAKRKAQGVAECRMQRYAPDTSWQALVMRGKEAGRFREVAGMSIIGAGILRSAVDTLNCRQLSGLKDVTVDRATIFMGEGISEVVELTDVHIVNAESPCVWGRGGAGARRRT